jgi:hypothetical protein
MREPSWARAYRTPLALVAVFVALLVVFAVTPDPTSGEASNISPTAQPSPGPNSCPICGIDQDCDPSTNQCRFIKHTPAPCVKTANFDDEAGSCLPVGVVAPPAPVASDTGRQPRFPRGIRDRRGSGLDGLPAIGD